MSRVYLPPPPQAGTQDWLRKIPPILNRLASDAERTADTVTGDATLGADAYFAAVDASDAAVTITLPAPVAGRQVVVKKIDSSTNAVTVTADAIDGGTYETISDRWGALTFLAASGQWWRV